MSHDSENQKPVESIKIGSSWCKTCEKLVQEKGHEHFNGQPEQEKAQ